MKGSSNNELGLVFWGCVALVALVTGSLVWLIVSAIAGWVGYHLLRDQLQDVNGGYFDRQIAMKVNALATTSNDPKYAEYRQQLEADIARLRTEQQHAAEHVKTVAGLAGTGVFVNPVVGGIALAVGMSAVKKEVQAAADAEVEMWRAAASQVADSSKTIDSQVIAEENVEEEEDDEVDI